MENLSNTFASFLNRLQQAFFFFDTAYLLTGVVFQIGMYYLLPDDILNFLSRPSHLFIEPWVFRLITVYFSGLIVLQFGRFIFDLFGSKPDPIKNEQTDINWYNFNQAVIKGDYTTHTDRYWLIQNYFYGFLGCSIVWFINCLFFIFFKATSTTKVKVGRASIQSFYESKIYFCLSEISNLYIVLAILCILLMVFSIIQIKAFSNLTERMLNGFIKVREKEEAMKADNPE
jgi:hypothetical protein